MKRPRKRALMSDMVSIAYEMKDLLENNDVDFVGELLDKNWKLKRQMTLGISDAQIDDLYNKGILAGATGGKLLGAGNGGFIMFFAPKEKHVNITKAMKNLKSIPFSFEGGGSKIVFSD
tara:strand:- start:100 stop:456 length:357 start_codon:yes stop_codon:yes gene_type:complete